MDQQRSMDELTEDLEERRRRVRVEMGGAHRVQSLRDRGVLTARSRIDLLLDDGSFREVGTFAVSWNPEDRDGTPGDGRICGFGLVDGRPVAVEADDVTVKGASSAVVNLRRMDRIAFRIAEALEDAGHPSFVTAAQETDWNLKRASYGRLSTSPTRVEATTPEAGTYNTVSMGRSRPVATLRVPPL